MVIGSRSIGRGAPAASGAAASGSNGTRARPQSWPRGGAAAPPPSAPQMRPSPVPTPIGGKAGVFGARLSPPSRLAPSLLPFSCLGIRHRHGRVRQGPCGKLVERRSPENTFDSAKLDKFQRLDNFVERDRDRESNRDGDGAAEDDHVGGITRGEGGEGHLRVGEGGWASAPQAWCGAPPAVARTLRTPQRGAPCSSVAFLCGGVGGGRRNGRRERRNARPCRLAARAPLPGPPPLRAYLASGTAAGARDAGAGTGGGRRGGGVAASATPAAGGARSGVAGAPFCRVPGGE